MKKEKIGEISMINREETMENIKVKLQQWSLLYREYIVGFVVGIIVGAIIF